MTARPAGQVRTMTYAEYLAAEEVAEVKHEYLQGETWAMTGGTLRHGALAMRVAIQLGNALAGRPCEVFSSDVRVRVVELDSSMYPDLTVVCGPVVTAPDDPHAITNPLV